MKLRRSSAVALCVLIALSARATSEEPKLTEFESGVFSHGAREFLVIRDIEDFRLVYQQVHRHAMPQPSPPAVDFGRELVLMAFMGEQPSTGYRIGFDPVVRTQGRVARVEIVEHKPSAGAIHSTVITSPYAMARLRRAAFHQVRFVDAEGATPALVNVRDGGRGVE